MNDKDFKNLKPGETFPCGNKNIYVKEVGYIECDLCLFKNIPCFYLQDLGIIPQCDGRDREDGKTVIFQEV
ncbi:hypothetical protein [Fusobacterium mortiferum]|uniref:Uncharacterized protein n=1 Tax=Fusobacterium mortiferum ATCC 9817 TaxID=469616 RepID=A0ABM6TX67_FUSMR|nr:hypothetical protein [Fusobacterium mortiferum]AVQ18872.1 hypothetical protein C4N19_07105 [Fusobacterium mortiferum ATCC 9817]EEO35118.1 hypothetical protein FMAG_00680 [Fusobacterium mortiferum ATCC 9817]